MALVDLSDFDLLDLILASSWPEEEQQHILEVYMQGFSEMLLEGLSMDLKESDLDDMKKLEQDPTVTPESLMKFYTDRIPSLESKVIVMALAYKKDFVLGVYQNKLDSYKTASSQQGKDAWEQLLKDAKNDNWVEVARLLKLLSSIYTPKKSPSH